MLGMTSSVDICQCAKGNSGFWRESATLYPWRFVQSTDALQ